MASKSKQGMTIAKRQREQRVKERRALKEQKKRDKKQPADGGWLRRGRGWARTSEDPPLRRAARTSRLAGPST